MTFKELQQLKENNRQRREYAEKFKQQQALQQQQNQLVNSVWRPGITNWSEIIKQPEQSILEHPKESAQGMTKVIRVETLDSALIKKILNESVFK